jgi:Uncharacterised nucleotidyltransferase
MTLAQSGVGPRERGTPIDTASLWARVDSVADRMDVPALLAHGIAPLAARRWRDLGRELPEALRQAEWAAKMVMRLTIPLLERARAAYPGRILVLKGPEIAALYPPGRRLFRDFDLLVEDAEAAQRALKSVGFVDAPGEEPSLNHLTPLIWPGVDLRIEIHSRPNWPRYMNRPEGVVRTMFDRAVRSRVSVEGLEAPCAAHQVLLVGAHCWKDLPLATAREVIDVSVLAAQADPEEIESLARTWQMERLWHATMATASWFVDGGRPPLANRLWARSLPGYRDATVFERHASRVLAPFWLFRPGRAVTVAAREVARDLRPARGETWRGKARRTVQVAANPSRKRSGLS